MKVRGDNMKQATSKGKKGTRKKSGVLIVTTGTMPMMGKDMPMKGKMPMTSKNMPMKGKMPMKGGKKS